MRMTRVPRSRASASAGTVSSAQTLVSSSARNANAGRTPAFALETRVPERLTCKADDCRTRAVIYHRTRTVAPDDVIVELRPVNRHFAVGPEAGALWAIILAAAVTIGDQVHFAVVRIQATADPRRRRGLGAGRTGGRTAAAAGAQI